MRIRDLPPLLVERLVTLDDHAQACARAASTAESALAQARNVLSGNYRPTGTAADDELFKKVKSGFDGVLKAATAARARANDAQKVLSSVKIWLEQLPVDSRLELIEPPKPNGLDLAGVRSKVAELRAAVNQLKNAPSPPPNLDELLDAYVGWLASKPVTVLFPGGNSLQFLWPGSPSATVQGGMMDANCNQLMRDARRHPEELKAELREYVEEACAAPLPPSKRPARIAELESELVALQALETMFVNKRIEAGDVDIAHDPLVPPHLVLGARLRLQA